MRLFRNIGLNFVGNAWNGLLIVLTAPWYISMLGMEGFGLVGFWQLLLYIFLIFDFGLGPALVRQFAVLRGQGGAPSRLRSLLLSTEKVCLTVAGVIGVGVFLAAPWIASRWLSLERYAVTDVEITIRCMALSIVGQLLNSLYANGLNGLQRHGAMNGLQMLGHGLRYIGGGLVLVAGGGIIYFFAFQGFSMLLIALLTRHTLLGVIGIDASPSYADTKEGLGQLARYSGGMFLTALLGMLLGNADRIILSKMLPTADLGRYTLAMSAAGFLQMIVFAFYRSYFPMFSELRAAGDNARLRAAYYDGCRLVGMIVVPAAVIGSAFSEHLIFVWIGRNDPLAAQIFRNLVLGTACAGLMWLPAAYQQASGWTSLHTLLMALALIVGIPGVLIGVSRYGALGGTTLMLVHGLIEITLGLWLMNRVAFRGENLAWYRRVLVGPLSVSVPIAALSKHFLPEACARFGTALWIGATGLVTLLFMLGTLRAVASKNRLTDH